MSQNTFNYIVDSLGPRLLGFATKQLGDINIAKDLVQDTFIVFLDKREDITEGKEKAFLFKVLSNKILDHFKLRKKNVDYEYCHLKTPDQSQQFEDKEILDYALARIKPLSRQLLTLRDLEGYSYQEVADILDLNIGKVKVYLFRARKALKEEIIRMDISYASGN